MASGILDVIKAVALNATDQSKPVQIRYGTVTKANPVEVKVDASLTLSESAGQLLLTRNVTNYSIDVTVDLETEETQEHSHEVSGKTSVTVHNALKVGETVVMLRKEGGQKYVVLDRLA